VLDADDKAPLVPGCIRVAPPGYHVLIERGHVELSVDAPEHFSRPSIDVALSTGAEAYGSGLVGIVLTGANADGADGLAEVRRRGGLAIVQDPRTAERATMPEAAIAAADPQIVSDLEDIAPLLVDLCMSGGAAPS
jgi:two-component system chemotaxis response regulator CheB